MCCNSPLRESVSKSFVISGTGDEGRSDATPTLRPKPESLHPELKMLSPTEEYVLPMFALRAVRGRYAA